jgi:hypothetical protein
MKSVRGKIGLATKYETLTTGEQGFRGQVMVIFGYFSQLVRVFELE